jgi:hypothetical protein
VGGGGGGRPFKEGNCVKWLSAGGTLFFSVSRKHLALAISVF